jgi:hypothetical protein
MRYFLDTEFIETGRNLPPSIDLISIGIVAEDGRELYLVSSDYDAGLANDWVKENVLPALVGTPTVPNTAIRDQVLEFCNPEKYGNPEFWGYYAAYDWVVFCWLFGAMADLPKGYPMLCLDIQQFRNSLGSPQLPKQVESEHHALSDAKWNKVAFDFLIQFRNRGY